MKTFICKTIKHRMQAYCTVGNYFKRRGRIHFRISKMGNEKYEALVLLHEIVEYILVKERGISLKEIDKFDIEFEIDRELGLHSETEECGDSPNAPYFAEHQFATRIEKIMAKELGVDWDEYDKAVNSL